MAIDLTDWAAGDTDYIATYNGNNAITENAVNALQASRQAISEKAQANGYAGLDADAHVPLGQLPATVELTTHKDVAGGYPSLDSGGHIPLAELPIAVQEVAGGAGIDLTGYQLKTAKDTANGYAGLDSGGKLNVSELPSTVEVTGHKGAASGYCDLDSSVHVPASRLVAGNMPDLSATYTTKAREGVASGVATLDSGGLIPDAQIPSGIARDSEVTSAISAALSGYSPAMPSGTANKVLATDASGGATSAAALRALVAADIPDLSGTYKIHAYAEPVLALAFWPDRPPASQVLLAFLPSVAMTIPANLSGTRCKAGTYPTATATLSVQKNGAEVATIQIATDGAITLSTQAAISLDTTDELTVVAPSSQDATLASVRFCIHGTR